MTDTQFESCIKKIRQGDKDGLREIYENYISFVYLSAYQTLRVKEDAEDISSEFFIKLWNIADKYRMGEKHKAWIATIVRNMAIDFLRKHGKEQAVEEIPEDIEKTTDSLEDEVISEITMEEMLKDLKEKEREIIHLKIVGEFTFQEIAEITGVPMGTVTWQYQNAMKKIRRYGYVEKI